MKVKLFAVVCLVFPILVAANEVEIVDAKLRKEVGGWRADVTLKHADTGWEHYADQWRLVSEKGESLGVRVLHHPHENEQPFTRSLSGIKIPDSVKVIFVEAHDKKHGWSKQRFRIELTR